MTKFIYLDESGDLSFNFEAKHAPRYFVMTALVLENPKTAEKIIRKTWNFLPKKVRVRRSGHPFHANYEDFATKTHLLKYASSAPLKFYSVILDKFKYPQLIGANKHKIYAELTLGAILTTKVSGDAEIIISRSLTKKSQNDALLKFIRENLPDNLNATVDSRWHGELAGLQVVDFIANAVYDQCETNKSQLYEIIAKKDKTPEALAEYAAVPLLRGNYLSSSSLANSRKPVKHIVKTAKSSRPSEAVREAALPPAGRRKEKK